jgi:hypothetical protein
MAEAIPTQEEHFVASGLEFGYAYDSPLIDTATEGPCPDGDVSRYHPTTRPGARLPHAVVHGSGEDTTSLHDLICPDGLTLLTMDYDGWTVALRQSSIDVPVAVTSVTAPTEDARQAVLGLLEIGEGGAVVVRPDGHVVWRSRTGPARAVDQLQDFIQTAWSPVYRGATSIREYS